MRSRRPCGRNRTAPDQQQPGLGWFPNDGIFAAWPGHLLEGLRLDWALALSHSKNSLLACVFSVCCPQRGYDWKMLGFLRHPNAPGGALPRHQPYPTLRPPDRSIDRVRDRGRSAPAHAPRGTVASSRTSCNYVVGPWYPS